MQEVKIFRGALSKDISLKLAGSEVSPFLSKRAVHALFQFTGISEEIQSKEHGSVRYIVGQE